MSLYCIRTWITIGNIGSRRSLLDPQADDTEQQEYQDPDGACDESELNWKSPFDSPSATHDVPHGLAGTGARQVPGDGLQVAWHALHGPENSRQEEDRVEAADGQLHGCCLGGTDDGNKKSWK